MANLSNINNKFLFTDGDFLKIGNLAPINNASSTESGISITNSNVASIALTSTGANGKTFLTYTNPGGDYTIYDISASSPRLTINTGGDATFTGDINVNGQGYFGPVGTGNATTKAEMQSNAVLRLKPHDTNSTNMNFAQVDGGSGIGVQVTNGPASANWNIALSPFGGNVGIGVASPSERLSVDGNAEILKGDDARVYIKDIGDSSTILLRSDGVNTSIGTDSNHDLQIQTNGSTKMHIESSGDVGIGYTGPYNQISGGENTLAIADASNASLYLKSNATNGHNHILFSGTSGNLSFYDKNRGDYSIVIKSDGNIGIGDTNPASKLVVTGRVQANSGSEPWAFVSNPTSGNYGGFLMQYGNNTKGVCYYNSNSIIMGSEGAAIPLRFTTNGNYAAHFSGTTGNLHVGGISDQDAKLYVTGGTTLAGNNTSAGAIRMYGDRKLPQANNFVRRNYNLTAGSSGALYSIARQWHDTANWGLGNINVIMWGIYYGQGQFNKADFSCRYGYSGNSADVQTNFNSNSMNQPAWTAATQVSGNIYYRDLQIQIPAYHQISFEIISPGLTQTYNINNTAHNTVYLYPH